MGNRKTVRMGELPMGELAIWQNNKGTWMLFYLFQTHPEYKLMRILWTSSGNLIGFSLAAEDYECISLGVATNENPYPLFYRRMGEVGREMMK